MKCSHCGKDGKAPVLESRPHDGAVYLRRMCGHCGRGFVSAETAPPGLTMPAAVGNSYARRGVPQPTGERAPRFDTSHLQGLLSGR